MIENVISLRTFSTTFNGTHFVDNKVSKVFLMRMLLLMLSFILVLLMLLIAFLMRMPSLSPTTTQSMLIIF